MLCGLKFFCNDYRLCFSICWWWWHSSHFFTLLFGFGDGHFLLLMWWSWWRLSPFSHMLFLTMVVCLFWCIGLSADGSSFLLIYCPRWWSYPSYDMAFLMIVIFKKCTTLCDGCLLLLISCETWQWSSPFDLLWALVMVIFFYFHFLDDVWVLFLWWPP